jgi:hypothetical protein
MAQLDKGLLIFPSPAMRVPCNDFAGSPLFYIDIDRPSNFPQKTKVTSGLNRIVASFPRVACNRALTRHAEASAGLK